MAKYKIEKKQIDSIIFRYLDLKLTNVCKGKNWVYFSDNENFEYSQLSLLKYAGVLYINPEILEEIEEMFSITRYLSHNAVFLYVKEHKNFSNCTDTIIVDSKKHKVLQKNELCS